MSKERSDDPSIAAALFCENVLVERDGTHSLIRVVDSVAMQADKTVDLSKEQTLTHPLALAVVLRSSEFSGTIRITIRHTPPKGGPVFEGLPVGAEIDVSKSHLTVASVRLTGGQVVGGVHTFEIRLSNGPRATAQLSVHFTHPPEMPPQMPEA